MEAQAGSVPLTSVLAVLGPAAREMRTQADLEATRVSGVRVWAPGEPVPEGHLLAVPVSALAADALYELLDHPKPLAIALCGPFGAGIGEDTFVTNKHALVRIPALADLSGVITAVDELTDPNRNTELRKLTSLQRSFSQALNQPAPVTELLRRLQKQTNAVCLVADVQGRVHESTGAIPLSLLLEQIQKTDADTQRVSASGWEGLAIRLESSAEAHANDAGWLIVAARRKDFPDAQSSAAAHIAATLVESARRTQLTARAQEEAIRAAIFDEALELDPRPDSPELASRLAALGFSLGTPLRVLAIAGTHPTLLSRAQQRELQRSAERALNGAEIPFLSTVRGDVTVLLAQAEPDTISRTVRLHRDDHIPYLAGIGREVESIADVADSFADALIAIRAMRAGRHRENTMCYEQFDFATRVFASIGLDRMSAYSRDFLEPLHSRKPMLEALRMYFQLSQNTSASADALGIHHNTLRYRLSKVEEILGVDLNDPSAVASLFLATTALDLMTIGAAKHLTSNDTLQDHEGGVTPTGITAPNADRNPSESITRSRPPRSRKY